MIPTRVENMPIRVERMTAKRGVLSAEKCVMSSGSLDVFAVVDRDASYKFTRYR